MDILYDYGVIEEVDGAKPYKIREEYLTHVSLIKFLIYQIIKKQLYGSKM